MLFNYWLHSDDIKIFNDWNGKGTDQPEWTPVPYRQIDARQLRMGPPCLSDWHENRIFSL